MYNPYECEVRIRNFKDLKGLSQRYKEYLILPIDQIDTIEYEIAKEGYEALSEKYGISIRDKIEFHKAVKYIMYWSYWERVAYRELLCAIRYEEVKFQ